MSRRRGWVGGVVVAAMLLAGCSTDLSGGRMTVGGPTTTPVTGESSAPSSAPSPAPSSAPSMSIPAGATPGAAGEGNPYGVPTEGSAGSPAPEAGPSDEDGSIAASSGLDPTSVVWFESVCQGLAPLSGLEQQATAAPTAVVAAQVLGEAGTVVTDTATAVNQLAPPAVDGGPALAVAVVQGLTDFGQTLSDFGARATGLPETDTAGFQQFNTDLQSALASTSPLGDAQLSPDVAAQVRMVPTCESLF